jgi:hypothetical protein
VDNGEAWAVAARERLRARLAAALLRAARWPGISASQAHEWSLRAVSADPQIEPLINSPGSA